MIISTIHFILAGKQDVMDTDCQQSKVNYIQQCTYSMEMETFL